jgi:hypothetical protein
MPEASVSNSGALRRGRRFSPLVVVSVGVLALIAAACGGGGSTSATKPASSQSPTSTTPSAPPGTFGTAAAVSPTSLEVQNPSTGQVTVNYNGSTRITQQATATAADVVPGACVAALPAQGTTGTPGQPFTARTVAITQPDASGSCTAQGAGFGGFGGGAGRGGNGGSSPSTTARSGNGQNRNPNARRFAGAFGKVASASGTSFVVQGNNRNGPMTTTVTTDASTTYTKVVSASSSALAVGQCIAATGPSDQTGAVTANTINIRQPGPNGCVAGRGGFGGRGGGGAGGGGGGGGGGSAT